MFNNKYCYNGGNKHNFQPRYTDVPNVRVPTSGSGLSNEALKILLMHNEYVYDICTWCGKIVKEGKQ